MKEIPNRTIYVCDFCKKKQYRKSDMVLHEFRCTKNPANWNACDLCRYCETVEVSYTGLYSDEYHEDRRTATGFHCTKLNIDMYPNKARIKKLPIKYPSTFKGKECMPNTCEHHETLVFIP